MRRLRLIALGVVLSLAVLGAMASRSSAPTGEPPAAPDRATATPAPPRATASPGTDTGSAGGAAPPAASPTPTASPTPAAAPPAFSAALADTLSTTAHALAAALDDERIAYAAALRARDAGAYAYATAMFGRVVTRDGVLAPVASLRLAQVLVSAGDRSAAAAAFDAALARDDFPDVLRVAARFDAADNAIALDDPFTAIERLSAIREDPVANASDRAVAAYDTALIRYEAGDPGWIDDALAVVTLQPWSTQARDALNLLEREEVAVSPFAAGYVRYRAFDNEAARAAYEDALIGAAASDAAIAWFYLGALDERDREPRAALRAYERSIALAPAGALADDARYWRGRILDEEGDLAAAVVEYDRLTAEFPGSPFAPDARMRAAIGLALDDSAAAGMEALARFRQITLEGSRTQAAEAARWHGVFRAHLGLTDVPALDPRTYDPTALPALLAAREDQAIGATVVLPERATRERIVPPKHGTAVTSWMRRSFGPAPAGVASPATDPRYVLGRELVYVGEPAVGRALFQSLLRDLDGRPYALLDVARAFGDLGLADLQLNAAERLLDMLSSTERARAPRFVLSLAYPTAFDEFLIEAATRSELPVLLLAALVRQESAWDPAAVSSANALGLTQVTVPTGRQIAAELGVTWDPDRLFDPEIALTFGAHYLATQLRSFDRDLAAAVAAYNAGPGSSARWLDAAPVAGTDGFRLAVDFSETARFISRVLENYAWYRYVYAGADAPALP